MARTLTKLLGVLVLAALVSAEASGMSCTTDDECMAVFTSKYVCEDSHCMRDHFRFDNFLEFLGMGVICFIALISNSGGVGAGTVIFSVITLFLSFSSKDAVHLSRIYTFAGSLVNFLINWKKRDPNNKDRFIINYNIAAVMIPLHLAGAEVGVMLGRLLPSIVVTLLLLCCLIMAALLTYRRAKQEQQKEQSSMQYTNQSFRSNTSKFEGNESALTESADKKDKLDADSDSSFPPHDANPEEVVINKKKKQNIIKNEELSPDPTDQIYKENFISVRTKDLLKEQYVNFIIMISAFLTVLMSVLIRGGSSRPSIFGFPPCSNLTWRYFWLSQFITASLAYCSYNRNKSYLIKQSIESLTVTQDRVIRNKIFLASYITGVGSGTVGVGGSMMLSVYMLSLGMDVSLSSFLATFSVLFSSSSTTIQSAIIGMIHFRHAYAVIIMSFIGSVIGNLWLRDAIKRWNKVSLILWSLVVILSIAVVVAPMQMIFSLFSSPREAFSFGVFC